MLSVQELLFIMQTICFAIDIANTFTYMSVHANMNFIKISSLKNFHYYSSGLLIS